MAKNKKPGPKYQLTAKGQEMAKAKSVSKKTQETVGELQNKFTKPSKKIVKSEKTATKETSKAKNVKSDNKTASKIKPLTQTNDFVDILSKIYSFMNKNYEEDKAHREKMENFKEENEIEAKKRHTDLLNAIKKLTKSDGDDTATKDDGSGGSIFDTLLSMFGLSSSALNLLKTVGPFLVNPWVIGLLGAAAAGTLAIYLMSKASEESHETANKVSGAMDVSGGGGAITEEQADAIQNKKQNLLRDAHKSGKIQGLDFSGAGAKKYLEEIGWDEKTGTTEAERTKAAAPASSTASTAPAAAVSPTGGSSASPMSGGESSGAATAVAPTPASAQLNSVQSENNNAKIDTMVEPSKSTINTVNAGPTESGPVSSQRSSIPPVRNLEETFQKMIIYSTRVV